MTARTPGPAASARRRQLSVLSPKHFATEQGKLTVEGPAQESRTAREGTDRDQEHGAVSDIIVVREPEQREAGQGKEREDGKVDAALLRLVADVGNGDGDDGGAHIRRHRVQLRLGVGPAEAKQDGRQEDRQALDRDVDEEEGKRARVVVDASDSLLDVLLGHGKIRVGFVLAEEALRSNASLALVEEVARGRRRGHPFRRSETNNARNETLKEEDVAPPVDAHRRDAPRRDLGETSGKQTTKGTGDGGGRHVDTDAEQELVALVKGAEEEGHSGHGTALKDTENGAGHHQAGEALDKGRA